MELKKEQDRLVIEKLQLLDIKVHLEQVFFFACHHIPESMEDLDAKEKVERLGVVIM